MSQPITVLAALLVFTAVPAYGQAKKGSGNLDISVTYVAERSANANFRENFWMQGGSAEVGMTLWKGLGLVADATGSHAGSVGTSGIPISLLTVTAGPRLRLRREQNLSFYVQALAGGANGFNSVFPAPAATQSHATSLAVQVGGGIDYRLRTHFDVRLLDVGWVRTQLPNSTNNVQNNLRLGAGLVFRFGR